MVDVADKRLFRAIQTSDHCLNLLLPGKRNVYASKLRSRGHKFRLPVMNTEMHKKVLLIDAHINLFESASFIVLFKISCNFSEAVTVLTH